MRIAQQVGLSLRGDPRPPWPRSPTTARRRAPTGSACRRRGDRSSTRASPCSERLRDDLSGCIGCGCLSLQVCPLYNPGDVLAEKGPGAHILLGDAD